MTSNLQIGERGQTPLQACKKVDNMLNRENASRKEIAELVSPSGKKKFWKNWPHEK